jgi:enamine deaminase RidA (YjgF/YER057c/UK114 family)
VADKSHPYSKLFEKDGIVYVSGTASMSYETYIPVRGRMEACDAALDEVEKRLATLGLKLSHVVKMIYFVTDITLRDEANKQFEQRFKAPRPARTVIGVSELPFGCSVAIDAIAHR